MEPAMNAGEILKIKGYEYAAIHPGASVYAALELMAAKNLGALLVMDGNRLVGMFSERDYARKVILKGKSSKNTTVSELMSSPPITISPDRPIRECMVLMTKNHIRHLPVMKETVLMGIISIGDVVHAIISSQEAAIRDLESYITVGY